MVEKMIYNIEVLFLANNDLHEIHMYLSDFGLSTQKKFRESFDKFINQVSNMPNMFRKYERNSNYRRAALTFGYLAFYRIDKQNNTIKIYRILHTRQNIDELL